MTDLTPAQIVSQARHFAEVLPSMKAPDVLVSTGAVAKNISALIEIIELLQQQLEAVAEVAGIKPEWTQEDVL